MKLYKTITLLFTTALISTSCLKVKEYPLVPQIKVLNAYIGLVDSTQIVFINFQFNDGDGDIGLEQGDTLAPYNRDGEFYNNLLVEYFEMQNGVWTKMVDIPLRIPGITPAGKIKTLEGEIELRTFYNDLSPNDTIKYSLVLIDRALNKSNRVETNAIIKP